MLKQVSRVNMGADIARPSTQKFSKPYSYKNYEIMSAK